MLYYKQIIIIMNMSKITKAALAVSMLVTTVFVAHPANAAGSLNLITPNGGESYKIGDSVPVQWSTTGNIPKVSLTVLGYKSAVPANASDEEKLNELCLVTNVTTIDISNNGHYDWLLDNEFLDDNNNQLCAYYKLQVLDKDFFDSHITDTSDSYFTISKSSNGSDPTNTYPQPDSGSEGTLITLSGTGFLASNTIEFSNNDYGTVTITNVPSSDGKTVQFQVPTSLPAGQYYVKVGNANGVSDVGYGFTVTSSSAGSAHPVGANVLGSDGTVYFINTGNTRSPYTSAGAFLSYKFNTWASVVSASSADMALPLTTYTPNGSTQVTTYFIPPRNGSLINDKGTVYLITNGLRTGFSSEKVFKELGFSFSNVYPGDTSFMVTLAPINSSAMAHPDGTLINDNGTIYVMKNGNRMGFPSMAVFDSWGYWMSEAVKANSYDRQAPVSGVIQTRMSNQLSI
jgi:hypothetical protein